MKKNRSKRIIWILAVLSPVLGAAAYPFLPEQVPMHWGPCLFICLKWTPERKITLNFQNITTISACL